MHPKKPQVLYQKKDGAPIHLTRLLASGGEGSIWQTNHSHLIAKIYHTPGKEYAHKINAMLLAPPVLEGASFKVAWPIDLLLSSEQESLGFLMPEIQGGLSLNKAYHPKLRNRYLASFTWHSLLSIAQNLCQVLESLHAKEYIVGDLKPDNFLVNRRLEVALIDTDSLQVPFKGGYFYCKVGSEGFLAPELIYKNLSGLERTKEQDYFSFALLLYLLLFGTHPFTGCWQGTEEMPSKDELILKGLWPENPQARALITPSPLTFSTHILSPRLREGFLKTFGEGIKNPQARYSFLKWHEVLGEALLNLRLCKVQESHFYDQSLNKCPWCEREKITGHNLFPTPSNQALTPFLVKKQFEQALQDKAYLVLLKIWKESSLIRVEYAEHLPLIKQVEKEVEKVEKFRLFYLKYPQDPLKLWAYWQEQDLTTLLLVRDLEIDGKPLKEFEDALKAQIKAYHTFEKALEFIQEQIPSIRVEEKIYALLHKFQPLLEESLFLRRHPFIKRAEEAKMNLKEWQDLKTALAQEEIEQALKSWKKNAFLRDYCPEPLIKEELDTLIKQKATFENIKNLYKLSSYQDEEVLAFVEEDKAILETKWAQERQEWLEGKSLKEEVDIIREREKRVKSLLNLLIKEPENFLKIGDLWQENLSDYPLLKPFADKIGKALSLKAHYHHFKEALERGEAEEIKAKWHEEAFLSLLTPLEKEHVLKAFHAMPLKESATGQSFLRAIYKTGIDLKWPWSEEASHYGIVFKEAQFAEDIEEENNNFFVVPKVLYHPSRGAFIPGASNSYLKSGEVYFSLWPGKLICGELSFFNPPLKAHFKMWPEVFYTIKRHPLKKHVASLTLSSKEPIKLPPLELVYHPERFPLPKDEEALNLMTIEETEVKGAVTFEFSLKDVKHLKTCFLRLYPAHRLNLDEIRFVCKRHKI